MPNQKNRTIFFETPEDKWKVFQKPRLVMFSEGKEVESWTNTQPLYFYPFSWLDYLNKEKIRELYLKEPFSEIAEEEIMSLESGKVHFEHLDERLIQVAKQKGHKVSIICNIEDLLLEQIKWLSISDFVRIRINNPSCDLRLLESLPNKRVLSCIKLYVEDDCDYRSIALQTREIGFDFLHVAKRLTTTQENNRISEEEREKIINLQELETEQFRVVIPSSLEERFARKFLITSGLGNVSSCDFSVYRLVLRGNNYYPCYTQQILVQSGFTKEGVLKNPRNCLDCACIYENDMGYDIKIKVIGYFSD